MLFADYIEDDPTSILNLLQFLKTGISIEIDYQDWCETATGPYGYRRIRRNSQTLDRSTAKARQMQEHDYNDIWMSHIWIAFRGGRIHLHDILLHCIELICTHSIGVVLLGDLAETKEQSQSIIHEMVADICASTSFSIGSADPMETLAGEGVVPLGGYFSDMAFACCNQFV